jgi:hypothetical protein
VITAELTSFSAVWLADQWVSAPPRLPEALSLARQLSVVTDRIELGLILRLPPLPLRSTLREQLVELDKLSDSRLRVALDLRGASLEDHAAGLDLLGELINALGACRTPLLARRLQLVADETTAVIAGAAGFGLLLVPGDSHHARLLRLARYHDAREGQPGWVSRLLSVAVGADVCEAAALTRALPATVPLLSPAVEPVLLGPPSQVAGQLAVAQISDGLDEVICAVVPGGPGPEALLRPVELLGRKVLPQLQGLPMSPSTISQRNNLMTQ